MLALLVDVQFGRHAGRAQRPRAAPGCVPAARCDPPTCGRGTSAASPPSPADRSTSARPARRPASRPAGCGASRDGRPVRPSGRRDRAARGSRAGRSPRRADARCALRARRRACRPSRRGVRRPRRRACRSDPARRRTRRPASGRSAPPAARPAAAPGSGSPPTRYLRTNVATPSARNRSAAPAASLAMASRAYAAAGGDDDRRAGRRAGRGQVRQAGVVDVADPAVVPALLAAIGQTSGHAFGPERNRLHRLGPDPQPAQPALEMRHAVEAHAQRGGPAAERREHDLAAALAHAVHACGSWCGRRRRAPRCATRRARGSARDRAASAPAPAIAGRCRAPSGRRAACAARPAPGSRCRRPPARARSAALRRRRPPAGTRPRG